VKEVAAAANGEADGEAKNGGAPAAAGTLAADLAAKRGELAAWCANSYGEAFVAWIHVCAVRLFVESVLRYGLPPRFLGAVIEPVKRQEVRARKVLAETFGAHGAQFWGDDGDGGLAGAAAGVISERSDMHPYVSFTLDLEGI
jgi:V-type H+-transporting ATPase subunit C